MLAARRYGMSVGQMQRVACTPDLGLARKVTREIEGAALEMPCAGQTAPSVRIPPSLELELQGSLNRDSSLAYGASPGHDRPCPTGVSEQLLQAVTDPLVSGSMSSKRGTVLVRATHEVAHLRHSVEQEPHSSVA